MTPDGNPDTAAKETRLSITPAAGVHLPDSGRGPLDARCPLLIEGLERLLEALVGEAAVPVNAEVAHHAGGGQDGHVVGRRLRLLGLRRWQSHWDGGPEP